MYGMNKGKSKLPPGNVLPRDRKYNKGNECSLMWFTTWQCNDGQ